MFSRVIGDVRNAGCVRGYETRTLLMLDICRVWHLQDTNTYNYT